jgi:uncharacterized protein YeeX (DUF496 family)
MSDKSRFNRMSIRVRATGKIDDYLASDVSCGEFAHILEKMSLITNKRIDDRKVKTASARILLNQITDSLRECYIKFEEVSRMEQPIRRDK